MHVTENLIIGHKQKRICIFMTTGGLGDSEQKCSLLFHIFEIRGV